MNCLRVGGNQRLLEGAGHECLQAAGKDESDQRHSPQSGGQDSEEGIASPVAGSPMCI